MALRRPPAIAAAAIAVVICLTYLYSSSISISVSTNASSSLHHLTSYFGAEQLSCPDPLQPPAALSTREHACQSLPTRAKVALSVQICYAPDVINQGYFLVARQSADECATAESKNPSLEPEENKLLRMRGPDTFHISIDGEQRWAAETDPEYLGNCRYKYPFNLAFGGPMNLTIFWAFSGYRATDETEVVSLQWDLVEYVLEGKSQFIEPPTLVAQGCPHISAIPSLPQWRSISEEAFLASAPECSRFEATKGRYLRAHWSEPHTFNGFMFQPESCRWSEPILVDAQPEDTQNGWQPRNVLFLGDSHVRYAFDSMSYVYGGDWAAYKKTPVMKAHKKTSSFGSLNMTFIWDAVLRETHYKVDCESMREFDTIVLGSSHHNLVKSVEEDHEIQFTVHQFNNLVENLATKLSAEACPGQQMPRVIWMGNTARPQKTAMPPEKHPLNHGWQDARVNPRLTLFNHDAWHAFKRLPGASRVNLLELSLPLADDFVDGLHMIRTDVQAAFVQELHQKLWLTQPAFAHLSSTPS